MGAVLSLRRTTEMDVVVSKAPGAKDLLRKVGTLYVDQRPDGTVHDVQFDPLVESTPNVALSVRRYELKGNTVHVVDDEDGGEWQFDIYELAL